MAVEIKFEGLTALVKGLEERKDLSPVKTVIKQNGSELQTGAQRICPVDTGALKQSISLELSDGGLTATVEPGMEYGAYVEYGTRYMSAQPYMRPSFESQKVVFQNDLKKLVR